jgi:biopolymer transport protein ExbB
LFELFESGGIVMWPLLFLSIISLACIFERISYWKKSILIKENQLNMVVEKLSIIDLRNQLNNINLNSIPLEKVLFDALKIMDQSHLDGNSNLDIKLALEISIQSIQAEFGRFSNLFSTVITISPLLGLLGTVLGLIESFTFIRLGDAGVNALEVTGGISEALISTATGLIVAIFTLIFSNYFNSLWKKQNSILNQYCGRFEMLYQKNKMLIK